jgi:hypothetical protein
VHHPADLTEFSRDLHKLQKAVDTARHEDPAVSLSEGLLLLQISGVSAELDADDTKAHVRYRALQA